MKDYQLLISGLWRKSGDLREIKSPYDRSIAGRVYFADKAQVEEAVAAAGVAFEETKKLVLSHFVWVITSPPLTGGD